MELFNSYARIGGGASVQCTVDHRQRQEVTIDGAIDTERYTGWLHSTIWLRGTTT